MPCKEHPWNDNKPKGKPLRARIVVSEKTRRRKLYSRYASMLNDIKASMCASIDSMLQDIMEEQKFLN